MVPAGGMRIDFHIHGSAFHFVRIASRRAAAYASISWPVHTKLILVRTAGKIHGSTEKVLTNTLDENARSDRAHLDFPIGSGNVSAINIGDLLGAAIAHHHFQLTLQDFEHPVHSCLPESS